MTVQETQVVVTAETPSPAAIPAGLELPPVIHRVNLDWALRRQVGKFVGVTFTKVDGQIRKLNGRLGVRCHLKGDNKSTVAADDRPYMVVYDVKSKGYRAVNLATVSALRAQRREYAIVG